MAAKVVPRLLPSSGGKNDEEGKPGRGWVDWGDGGPQLEAGDEQKVLIHETTVKGRGMHIQSEG